MVESCKRCILQYCIIWIISILASEPHLLSDVIMVTAVFLRLEIQFIE